MNEWELQYGMNNYKRMGAKKGKELFITNYEIKPHPNSNINVATTYKHHYN
jgi:DNA adenine methylase